MKAIVALAIGVSFLLAGCSSSSNATGNSTSAGVRDFGLGDTVEFKRADTGARIGTVKVTDVVEMPVECALGEVSPGSYLFGVRLEVSNDGRAKLPKPDYTTLKVNDEHGVTRDVETPRVYDDECPQYPEISGSVAPGKTDGWIIVLAKQPNPSALIYAPVVLEEGATLENMKFIAASPPSATVKVPAPAPQPAQPAPTEATTTPAPPVTGQPAPARTRQPDPTTTQPPVQALAKSGEDCFDPDAVAVDQNGRTLYCNPTVNGRFRGNLLWMLVPE